MSWSTASPVYRIDWRPSLALSVALPMLGLLAVLALQLTALPGPLAWLGGTAALLESLRLSRQHWRQPACRIVWAGCGKPALVQWPLFESQIIASMEIQQPIDSISVHLRGPIAVMTGLDERGRQRRWVWYPDTLCPVTRRALRLAASAPVNSPSTLPIAAA